MQLSINESLLDQAMQAGGVASQTQTLEVALKLLIEALSKHNPELLEDLEDIWEGEQTLRDINAGREKTITLEALERELDMQ
jgi:hypothetical protein